MTICERNSLVEFLDHLKKDFQKLAAIPDGEWINFAKIFQRKTFKKGEYFVLAGNFSTNFGFVEKGLMRYFYTTFEGHDFHQAFRLKGT